MPYKRNRAVIFDSSLLHETDRFRFKRGYRHRRINLTLLFGLPRQPGWLPRQPGWLPRASQVAAASQPGGCRRVKIGSQ